MALAASLRFQPTKDGLGLALRIGRYPRISLKAARAGPSAIHRNVVFRKI
jgi:hypothetical protein